MLRSRDEICEMLKHMNLRAVSLASGVEYTTLWRLSRGQKNFSYETIEKLNVYFEGRGEVVKMNDRG